MENIIILFLTTWLFIGLFSTMGLLIANDNENDLRNFWVLIFGMFLGYIQFFVLLKDIYSIYNTRRF